MVPGNEQQIYLKLWQSVMEMCVTECELSIETDVLVSLFKFPEGLRITGAGEMGYC